MSKEKPVRVAALGDIHLSELPDSHCRALFSEISDAADVLVLCGDLTNRGRAAEAHALVDELGACKLPIVAVLGNHDCECGEAQEVRQTLMRAGVAMLDDAPIEVQGIGFAGVSGFCGGFDSHALAPFGEQLIKDFVRTTIDEALQLETGLAQLRTPHKVAVLHYAPVRDTVVGEPPEIFPFLGSSRLAEPIDRYHASVVFHGHAHNGSPRGSTLSGIPVYNVALPLLRKVQPERPYVVCEL